MSSGFWQEWSGSGTRPCEHFDGMEQSDRIAERSAKNANCQ